MISKKGLERAIKNHPGCGSAAREWYKTALRAEWASLEDVRRIHSKSVDQVGQVLIFNLRGNAYRLIATVYYPSQTIYIKALLSHAEYDKKEWMKWA